MFFEIRLKFRRNSIEAEEIRLKFRRNSIEAE